MNQALKRKPVDSIHQPEVENRKVAVELALVPKPASKPVMTMEALNESLAYFYNHGGPAMEEKDGVIVKNSVPRPNHKNSQARPRSGQDLVKLVTSEGPKTVSIDYLNEKLSYFYSHGGPIMDI
jgi:hypothetical protein